MDTERSEWLTGIGMLLGLWLFLTPAAFGAAGLLGWVGTLAGVAVTGVAAYEYRHESDGETPPAWTTWIPVAAGVAAVVGAFALSATGPVLFSYVGTGLLVAAIWAYEGYEHDRLTVERGRPLA